MSGDRVFRTVMPAAAEEFEFVRSTGLLEELASRRLALNANPLAAAQAGEWATGAAHVVEQPRIPYISYPYEWTFAGLKAAALLHLDVHLEALSRGVTLSDASAYNVQFVGSRPTFIDCLSFRRYRNGEYWAGHRQFCEQFLNPLLLRALTGVPFNAWYRGAQEGIGTTELSRLLPFRRKLSWNVITHVLLQAAFQKRALQNAPSATSTALQGGGFPLSSLRQMLSRLRGWIAALEQRRTEKSTWSDYAETHSYAPGELEAKRVFIADFAASVRPRTAYDIGCNTGLFSEALLSSGATYVVGFDFDLGALEGAFKRSQERELAFLPLFMDACNPSPSQGWGESERRSLSARAPADGLTALALVHHLAIGRNIPLDYVVKWLVRLAPRGVVEFVPKADPMVQELLRNRSDIFPDYREDAFAELLAQSARIVRSETVTETGRRLFFYDAAG